jgi:cell division control protein 6
MISLFVNLRKAQTSFGCVNLILSELGQSQVKSYEGVSKAFEMIQNRIREICSIQNKNRFILVLDEFDVIFSDKRHSPSDFIFKILQMVEDLRDQKLFVTILAISNNTISNYDLDDRVKSRMGVFEVYFLPYGKNTILQILSERARLAFKDKLDDSVLDKCAQISHDETGDCRRAIDLLKLSADIAAGQKITLEHVDEAQKRLNFDRIDHALKNLTNHQRLALAAFSLNVLQTEREIQTTSSLYEQYNSLCAHSKMPALEYRRFSDILSDLQRVGLVLARNRSHGRYGYAKEFEICVDYKLVGYRIDPDWWTKTFQQKIDSDRVKEELKEIQRMRRQLR